NANVLTWHNDVGRTGQNLNETTLTTANVNSSTFGKLGSLPVAGIVDAEPLYVSNLTVAGAAHNVVFVATEGDLVYAFDADTFAQLWKTSVLASGETTSDLVDGCGQVAPEIGITSTPVIDLSAGAHGTIFVVGMSKDTGGNYHQRLHALDLTTGAEQPGSPTEIQATFTAPVTGAHTVFDPMQYKERVGLLLLNGVIYMGFASHCDTVPYQGWLMGYTESTLQQSSVLNLTPNGSQASIWMAGAGLAADSNSNIYFLLGNGTFDETLDANGFPDMADYGNGFIKVSTAGNSLAVADYFNMHDTTNESNGDVDLGSGGAMVLPDQHDNVGNTWHLAVGAGKDQRIYLVNRDSMGKFNTSNDSAIYQELDGALPGGVWSAPAYFNGAVYYGSVNNNLSAFTISNAKLSAAPTSQSPTAFGYPGTTPSISANGNSNGIVWAIENGGRGTLHAYNAANLQEIYNSNQAANGRDQFNTSGNCKFVTPMIANGRVFVGTGAGVSPGGPGAVIVFGLLQ
ncbi:MAG TPA: pyrrolo-quinoline quinone, partial [Candidatus Bathyarchaeia archaeon]|nr:pyrrolo-quinoline quinone [Candidatus Bathyarchaeia archaeon]